MFVTTEAGEKMFAIAGLSIFGYAIRAFCE
jgi:hypothetical protein